MEKVAKRQAGFVYVIKSINGTYKIGFSSNPVNRLMDISVANHGVKMKYVYAGTISDEKTLHSVFSAKRVGGEWFNLSKEDLSMIRQYFSGKEDIEALRMLLVQLIHTKAKAKSGIPAPFKKTAVYDLDNVVLTPSECDEIEKMKISYKSVRHVKRFWQEDRSLSLKSLSNLTGYCERSVWAALSALRAANL